MSPSEDRRLLATAGHYVGCVFDVVANKQLLCRPIPSKDRPGPVLGVTISRAGDRIGFISGYDAGDAMLTILDGPGWKRQRDVKLAAQALSLAGAHDGRWYAVGCADNLVRVYGASNEPIAALDGHAAWPRTVSVSPDGSHLASIDEKSGVRLWRTADWSPATAIREARGTDVCFDPTGSRIATVRRWGRDLHDPSGQVLRVWALADGQLGAAFRVEGFEFEPARFSPDGAQLACGLEATDDNLHHEAVLLDARSGRVVQRLRGPFDWYTDFAFLPARGAIALGVRGHTRRPLVLWELTDAAES